MGVNGDAVCMVNRKKSKAVCAYVRVRVRVRAYVHEDFIALTIYRTEDKKWSRSCARNVINLLCFQSTSLCLSALVRRLCCLQKISAAQV